MKTCFSIALFLCSFLFASNAQAAGKQFVDSGSVYSGQTKTHKFTMPYTGTVTLQAIVPSNHGSYILATLSASSGVYTAVQTSSSSTTQPFPVTAGDVLTIQVQTPYINPQYSNVPYTIVCTLIYTPNSPPVISSISASPSSTTYGNSVTVNVSASDVDGNLSYVRFTKGSSSVNDTASPYAHTYSGLTAGSHSVTAYAVDTKAASASKSVSFTITKANPSVTTWPSASTITYTQTLASSSLSSGKANIAGSFSWANSGTVPTAGTRGYTVVFTPTDTDNYNNLTHAVNVATNKANPSVTAWPSASTITYGQTLANSSLSGGKANIAGSFAWTSSGTKPTAGTRGYTVVFTPTDTANYNSLTHSVSVATNKATKEVSTWPSATSITYGQTLASSALQNGVGSVSGSFSWVSSGWTANAGTYYCDVRFTPTDTTNYNTVTGSVRVIINKANPAISRWPNASTITYGQALASSSLVNGAASPEGQFSWNTDTSVKLKAGAYSYSVKFVPTDTTNFNTLTNNVGVTVNKANPSISAWPNATTITYPQKLSSSTLTGGSATPGGQFAWNVSTTTITPPIGASSYSVKFTPTDSENFNVLSANVSVTSLTDPNSDLDGDGLSYAEEQKLGTNPDVPAVSDSSNATKLSVF